LQVSPVGQGDGKAQFLADFRALRDGAALDYEELAARAHYPSGALKEAEAGPGLPGLPVLAAYVRACGGDVLEWEERWRRLDSGAEEDADLPVRHAGESAAAAAGARAGVTVAPADVYDAERVKAALRAHGEREEQQHGTTRVAAGAATMLANGNHHKKSSGAGPHGAKARLTSSRLRATSWLTDAAAPAPTDEDATSDAATSDRSATSDWSTTLGPPGTSAAAQQDRPQPGGSGPREDGSRSRGSGQDGLQQDGSLPGAARPDGSWQGAFGSRQAVTVLALVCAVVIVCVVVLIAV